MKILTDFTTEITDSRSKSSDVSAVVKPILADIAANGDKAVLKYVERFDSFNFGELKNARVTEEETKAAYKVISKEVIDSLKQAKANIEKVHSGMLIRKTEIVESMPGVKVWSEFRPIENVGLYVPGGTAAYPSTMLMLGVPAVVAGAKNIVICSPADENGKANPAVLVAADICGIKNIYKIGGAQAIAAMAYGTETIQKVDKIFGPGNAYVTAAKQLVSGDGQCAIDMPAGPSEIAVIANETANPAWIAADLLSQLEHDKDSQAFLVTFSQEFANKVIEEVKKQMQLLPRKAIIEKSFAASFAVVVENEEKAVEVMNQYAPEHLEIILGDSEKELNLSKKINNAGSIFLGPLCSEPLGDYATGANHTLPTSGFAKAYSSLSAAAFGKMIQIQTVNQEGFNNLASIVEILAEKEGLAAHARAITIRK
jgi:histidinol dehydrogenase